MSEQDPPTPERLRSLRERLDSIDAAIVDAIAERQAVVAEIGDLKQNTGSPLRHYAREREVIERGMARYLDTVSYQVLIADPSDRPSLFERTADWRQCVDTADLVVVAAPLRPSNEILLELAELRPRGLVFDIGSLKSPMQEGLVALQAAGCRVCSVHPMFGPNEIGLSGRHILFVDVGHAEAVQEARDLFAHTAADCVDLSLEEHDEVMAWVLGLSHLVNIAFAAALADSGEAVPLLERISSSTFNAQLQVAAQVVSENPHLYFEIQHGNASTADVVRRFRDSLDQLAEAVVGADEARFVAAMERAHRRLSEGRRPAAIGG